MSKANDPKLNLKLQSSLLRIILDFYKNTLEILSHKKCNICNCNARRIVNVCKCFVILFTFRLYIISFAVDKTDTCSF
jgi:hypothetical protein